MKPVSENQSLKQYNTFGIDVKARWMTRFASPEELGELTDWAGDRHIFILGGGSNILFTKDIDSLVLLNQIKGITQIAEDEDHIYVRAGAGENWNDLVQYCIARNWAGLENLSLIPGNVGAAPMQNIGAYGVEIRDVFWELEAWHLAENRIKTFTLQECEFGYRESVFKRRLKDQFVILNVVLRLRKDPIYHISYGAIKEELGDKEPTIKSISDAVIRIRQSKLPDPAQIGNAGSFFKNPTVATEIFDQLKQQHPGIIGYPTETGDVKLAAGWLIEQCGWKGIRRGDAGVHGKQALVLVNYGNATGAELYALSEAVLQSVQDRFGIMLEREVNLVS